MKKRKSGRVFSRTRDVRRALMRSQIRSLVLHERMKTTEAKAREVAPLMEKMITKARRGGLAIRRELAGMMDDRLAKKMIEEIAPRYKEREGGYTRIIKAGPRVSDGAKMAVIELVS